MKYFRNLTASKFVFYTCLLVGIGAGIFTPSSGAQEITEPKREHVLAAIEENDLLYNPEEGKHQDRHYTQGLKFIYLDGGQPASWWARGFGLSAIAKHLPDVWLNSTNANFGVAVGQNIYTPENNLATNLLRGDRPYAGWLYLGIVLQRHGMVLEDVPVLENFELDFGIMGPEAQAGRSQNEVHKFREIPGFDGWGNQLKSEPGFILKYGRAWKFSFNETSSHYFDVIPNVGANLGTIMVSGNAGVTTRLGFNLPNNFGVQTINSPLTLSTGSSRGPIGAYVFGQVEGTAVGRNAFLDGNLYRESFHVKKEPFVGDLIYGLALTLGNHIDIAFTRVVRTREFTTQKGYDRYGSLTGKLKWDF